MRTACSTVALAATLLLPACATSREPAPAGDSVPASSTASARTDTTAAGTVRVVGSVPMTAVTLTGSTPPLVLTGDLRDELARLDGAVVTVQGPLGPSPVPVGRHSQAVTVRSYTIDSVGGAVPIVGTLSRDGPGFRLGDVPLAHVPSGFESLVGAKLWVVGPQTAAGAVEVSSYGVIRPVPD